jgi:tRNA(fMet)-specific endonuclease VapC
MAVYMLDTDISSYIMKRTHDGVLRRLQRVAVSDVCVSVITKAEMMYGVEVSPRRQ